HSPRSPRFRPPKPLIRNVASFDTLFPRREERQAFRQYLIGLLLPREHNKTLVELAALVPGAKSQRLHPAHARYPAGGRGRQWPAPLAVAGPPLSGSAPRRGTHPGRDWRSAAAGSALC